MLCERSDVLFFPKKTFMIMLKCRFKYFSFCAILFCLPFHILSTKTSVFLVHKYSFYAFNKYFFLIAWTKKNIPNIISDTLAFLDEDPLTPIRRNSHLEKMLNKSASLVFITHGFKITIKM